MDQLQTMINNMPEKTGKSLSEWKVILREKNFAKHGEAMKFLKGEHGVSHGFANTIIQLAKQDSEPEVDLVAAQYAKKPGLVPIYERLLEKITALGGDIEVAPKKTSVSLRRKTQFALVKPATKTRIDLGLKIKGKETGERLQDSGPFGTMCTHRVQVTDADQVDEELMAWIKEAYEAAG